MRSELLSSDLMHNNRSTDERWSRCVKKVCERGGGRPGLPSLKLCTVSVDVKQNLKKKCRVQVSGAV